MTFLPFHIGLALKKKMKRAGRARADAKERIVRTECRAGRRPSLDSKRFLPQPVPVSPPTQSLFIKMDLIGDADEGDFRVAIEMANGKEQRRRRRETSFLLMIPGGGTNFFFSFSFPLFSVCVFARLCLHKTDSEARGSKLDIQLLLLLLLLVPSSFFGYWRRGKKKKKKKKSLYDESCTCRSRKRNR